MIRFGSFLAIGVMAVFMGGKLFAMEAPKVTFEYKAMLESHTNDNEVSGTTYTPDADSTTDMKFTLDVAKLYVRGKYNDKLSYTLRLNQLKGDDGDLVKADRIQLHYKINDTFSLTMGRMWVLMGTIEQDYSTLDIFHFSETYQPVDTADGVQFEIAHGDHWFGFQVLNADTRDCAGDAGLTQQEKDNFIMTAYWSGSFANGMVKPIVSYGMFPTIGCKSATLKDDNKVETNIAAGVRFNAAGAELDVDYVLNTMPKYDQVAASTDAAKTEVKKEEKQAMIFQVRYNFANPKIVPFIKYSMDTFKTGGDKMVEYNRFSAGASYFPITDSSFRYFLAYRADETVLSKDATGTKEESGKQSFIYLGAGGKI